MWNKLRARHYSILILAAVVALETSAIAIDRFFTRADNTAFEVVGQFRNNSFFDHFKVAEAKSHPIPASLNQFAPMPKPVIVLPDPVANATAEAHQTVTGMAANAKDSKTTMVAAVEPKIDPERWFDYLVRKGDSLAAIAGMFQTQADTIKSANRNDLNAGIKAGQKIKIPLDSTKLVYAVKSGDTLTRISTRFGIPVQDLVKANNLKDQTLHVGQKVDLPIRLQGKALELAAVPVTDSSAKKEAPVMEKLAMVPASPKLALVKTNVLEMVKAPAQKPTLTSAKVEAEKAAVKETPVTQVASLKPAVVEAPKTVEAAKPAPEKAQKILVTEKPVEAVKKVVPVVETQAASVDGDIKMVAHTVKSGDSLATLARQYKTSISEIVSRNNLPKSALKPGQKVQIPVNKKFYRVLQVTSRRADVSTKLGMPVHGSLTDPYGWRNHPVYHRRLFHAGVDFAAPRGTPISAAMNGTVIYAGWLHGYGKLIVIRHPNGFSTRYGHCSSLRVSRGQSVRKGQIIGGVGSTGTATGNHLHFEVRRNGTTMNPLVALNGR